MNSLFQENNDASTPVSGVDAALPPRVGFLHSFELATLASEQNARSYSIERTMLDTDNQQVRQAKELGVQNPPKLSPDAAGPLAKIGFDKYFNTADFYVNGGTPEQADDLREFDNQIDTLRQQFPNKKWQNSREMWDTTRMNARALEEVQGNERTTIGGKVGSMLGDAMTYVNPEYNPVGFLTLGVGEVAAGVKPLLGKMATEGGVFGAAELVNQVTGVQDERALLGYETGAGDIAQNVLGAALGGAAFRGLHEAVGFGYHRYFRDVPGDPAPPPPDAPPRPTVEPTPEAVQNLRDAMQARPPTPYHEVLAPNGSRLEDSASGRARLSEDAAHADTELQSWGGEHPAFVEPPRPGDTAMPQDPMAGFKPSEQVDFEKLGLDSAARAVDPKTFAKYDQLVQAKNDFRNVLESRRPTQPDAEAQIQDIMDRMDVLKDKIANANPRKAKIYGTELANLEAQRAAHVTEAMTRDKPEMAFTRRNLMRSDEQLRDLAPAVGRAYARARKEWTLSKNAYDDVKWMVSRGNPKLIENPEGNVFRSKAARPDTPLQPLTREDKMPILRDAATVADKMDAEAGAADYAKAILQDQAKRAEEILETYRKSIPSILKDEKADTITIAGTDTELKLSDKITVENVDGKGTREISLRQLLEEQDDVEAKLKAVTSCSI